MAVRISVGADAGSALKAATDVKTALEAAGLAGKSLSNINFAQSGLGAMAQELREVERNLHDLLNVGRGETASAARKIFGKNPTLSDMDKLGPEAARMFPNPADRSRFVNNFGQYVFGGSSFMPPPPGPPGPPAPGPPAPGGGGGYNIGGAWDMLKGGLLGGAGFFMAQAGLGSLAALGGKAVDASKAESGGVDELLRRSGAVADTFGNLQAATRAATEGIHTNYVEMARYSAAFAAASGLVNGAAVNGARLGAGVSQAYGIDTGSYLHASGQAAFLGVDPARFAELIGEASSRGDMGGKTEEVMSAILQFTQGASRYSMTAGGLAGSVGGFADLYAAMNASKSPALRGANAMGAIDSINSSIIGGGGGGMAGQVFTMQAMMGAGLRDPYDIQMQLAGGAFEPLGGKGDTNFSVIMRRLRAQYGGGNINRLASAGSNLFGINPRAMKALLGAGYDQHADLGKLNGLLEANHLDINSVNPTAIPDIIGVANASGSALQAMRGRIRGISNLSVFNQNKIDGATDEDSLRKALVGGLNQTGMARTDATDNTDALNKMTNILADSGSILNKGIDKLTTGIGELVDGVKPLVFAIDKYLGISDALTPHQDVATLPGIPGKLINAGRGFRMAPNDHTGDFVGMVANLESSNGATSSNKYQFMNSTWADDVMLLAQSDPEVAKFISGKSAAQIQALKSDPNLSRRVADFHFRGINRSMEAQGIKKTDLNAYALWHFGNAGGARILRSPDSALMKDVVNKAAYDNNPYLHPNGQSMTVGQWKGLWKGRGASDTAFHDPSGSLTGPHEVTVAPSDLHITVVTPTGTKKSTATMNWRGQMVTGPQPYGKAAH